MPFLMPILINSSVTLGVFTKDTISLMTEIPNCGTRKTKNQISDAVKRKHHPLLGPWDTILSKAGVSHADSSPEVE